MREPLFLLHGFAGSARIWDSTAKALADDFDVVAPDWPGYGNLAHAPPLEGAAAMAAHVVTLADRRGAARFHVLGHSMSGFVVQELMLAHGERLGRAVLYGAGVRVEGRFETIARTIERLEAEGVDATVRRVAATWFVEGATHPAYGACVESGRKMSPSAAVAAMKAFELADYRGQLGGCRVRALVIQGDHDRTFAPEEGALLYRELSEANLCILPGCAHAAHLERPAFFEALVRDFLIAP